jgi:hypothetical protein
MGLLIDQYRIQADVAPWHDSKDVMETVQEQLGWRLNERFKDPARWLALGNHGQRLARKGFTPADCLCRFRPENLK